MTPIPLLAQAAIAFVFGAVIGSFINVVIYRLPRGESLVVPRSRCPSCQTPIHPRDNIPILSYLLLRARCRHCGAPIAWRYPVVEAIAGVLLAVLWIRFGAAGEWLEFIASAIFVMMLLAIFFIDLEHQIVPNAISYPGLAIGLLVAIPQGRFLMALTAAAGAGVVFALIAIASRGGMGGGDVKLAAMMGAFLGWPTIAFAVLLAFTLGATVGLLLIATGRRSRKDPIPFGPALATGAVVALFIGDAVIRWYLGS